MVSASLAACGAPSAEEARDNRHPTFVSLNPCTDAILVEVALPEQVLALSHYSRDPAASSMDVEVARGFGVTGGTAEEVIALQPDIVLASSFIAPTTRAALESAGLRVESFGSPSTVTESADQVERLAMLTGQEEAGRALAARITAPGDQSAGEAGSALLWQPGQIVGGASSLVADHLRWAGFTSYAQERGLAQADHITLEQILTDPPDLLLVAGDSAGQRHPVLAEATGAMQVARFEPNLFYCAGPSVSAARERLTEIRRETEAQP